MGFLYPREFEIFLARGGYLAWGIVPTTDEIQAVHTASLGKKFRAHMEYLSHSISSELLNTRILLTPSCGAGSRSTEEAEKIFRTLGELKHNLATVS